jgi:3-oxoadipate enol-lactonase
MWEPQMQALAGRFRVVRYDSRGHGRSEVTPGPYTIAMLANDAVGLLDALALPSAHFCGLSMGGMVGMWLGVHAPQRIDRLVLANTGAKIGTGEIWNARIDAVQKGGMAAIASGVLARWFSPQELEQPTPLIAQLRATFEATPTEGYVASCAAVRDMDQRQTLHRIRAPTLVIAGTEDHVTTPDDARFIVDEVRNARYVELQASHLSNIQAASAFTHALVQFLTGRF